MGNPAILLHIPTLLCVGTRYSPIYTVIIGDLLLTLSLSPINVAYVGLCSLLVSLLSIILPMPWSRGSANVIKASRPSRSKSHTPLCVLSLPLMGVPVIMLLRMFPLCNYMCWNTWSSTLTSTIRWSNSVIKLVPWLKTVVVKILTLFFLFQSLVLVGQNWLAQTLL